MSHNSASCERSRHSLRRFRLTLPYPLPYSESMDASHAEAEVLKLAEQLAEQRQLAESATRKVAGLRTIIRGYVEIFPELEPLVETATAGIPLGSDTATPRGAEAVRLILQAQPNVWFVVSELVQGLGQRGWMPDSDNPANAVRTALERLLSSPNSDIVKERRHQSVVYAYMPDRDTDPPVPAYDSDEEPF